MSNFENDENYSWIGSEWDNPEFNDEDTDTQAPIDWPSDEEYYDDWTDDYVELDWDEEEARDYWEDFEDEWKYEYRGRYSRTKWTVIEKIRVRYLELKGWIKQRLGYYDDIPF